MARRDPSTFPRATHGIPATYARGCSCDACRIAWREARRDKERERRRKIAAELKELRARYAAEQEART